MVVYFSEKILFNTWKEEQIMPKAKVVSYVYPLNGRCVEVSMDPSTWPKILEEVGFVPPDAVIRDEKQSRQIFDPEETRQIEASIKSVGQSDPAKVRLLTDEEIKELPKGSIARYFMNGGERRHRAIVTNDIPVFKIMVVEFNDEADEVMAGLVDNSCRAKLAPMDYAFALKRAKDLDPRISDANLGKQIGWNGVKVGGYISLTRLCDRAQELINTKALAVNVGTVLSKVESTDDNISDHDLQLQIIELLMENDWNSVRQIVEIKKYAEATGRFGAAKRQVARDPRKNRALLENSLWTAAQKTDILLQLSEEERVKMFTNISPEEIHDTLQAMRDRVTVIIELYEAMEIAAHNATTPKITSGEQVALMLPGWIAVDHWDENHLLKLDGIAVSPTKYRVLVRQGRIVGQKGPNSKLPEGLPSPDELDRRAIEGEENFEPEEVAA